MKYGFWRINTDERATRYAVKQSPFTEKSIGNVSLHYDRSFTMLWPAIRGMEILNTILF